MPHPKTLLFLASLLVFCQCQPQLSISNFSSSTLVVPNSILDGYYFIESDGILVNITDGTVLQLPNTFNTICSSIYVVTSNDQMYCLGISSPDEMLQINFLEDKVDKTWKLNTSSSKIQMYATGDTVLFSVPEQGKFLIFNSTSSEFICQNSETSFGGQVSGTYFSHGLIIWAERSPLQYNYSSSINVLPCGSTNVSSTTLATNTDQIYEILAFNHSSYYVVFYTALVETGTQGIMTPFTLISSTVPVYGPKIECLNVAKLNDTHMIITQGNEGYLQISMGILNPHLQFYSLGLWFASLNATAVNVKVTEGTLNVTITLQNSLARFVFDFSIGVIVSVDSEYPPVLLANGSTLWVNELGTFMSTPGILGLTYNNLPINQMYYEPASTGILYGSFVPFGDWTYYTKCSLITIDINASTLNQTIFPSCPITILSKSYSLLDVKYGPNGETTMAYRDGLGGIFIVNSTNVLGPYNGLRAYTNPVLSLNLTNNTATFVGCQFLVFTIQSFSLSDASVYFKTQVVSDNYADTFKMSDSYVLLGTSTKSKGVVMIYDMWSHLKVYQHEFDFFVQNFYALQYYYPNNPGLLLINGNAMYVVNPQNQISQIPIKSSDWLYNIQVIDSNSFFVNILNYNFYYNTVYNITNWYAMDDLIEF